MPEFIYEAFDPQNGTTIKDIGEYRDAIDLFKKLKAKGLILTKYRLRRISFLERLFSPRVTRLELAEFCRNLAFMIRGGVPILQALSDLEKTVENRSLRIAVRKLIRNIEEGRSFSEGIKSETKVFPPIVQALVLVGEETGKLDETLESASNHLIRIHEIISNTKQAMIYPVFLLVSLTGAMSFWIFYVLPNILKLFKEMNIKLPFVTIVLLKIVSFCTSNWLFFLAIPFFSLILYLLIKKSENARLFWERFLLRIPFIKKAKRFSLMSFFFEYSALLLRSGIDLIHTLDIMNLSMNSPLMNRIIEKLKDRIQAGNTFVSACELTNFFTYLDLRMIRVGEETGRLVDQLQYLADYYSRGLEVLVQTISKIVEPLLIIVAGVLLLIIALALIGPIYELISSIASM